MPFKDPQGITKAGIATGIKKSKLSPPKAIVAGFLAGAYIAFAGLLAVTVSAGLNPDIWGNLGTFITGAVFSLGLILVILAGSELVTGNMALVPMAAYKRQIPFSAIFTNFGWVILGNLIGSLFVAFFFAVEAGIVTVEPTLGRLEAIAEKKAIDESLWQIFVRAVGCNWLVCLAVWMALAAEDVAGKILAIFFPIMAFVAMGFDHVVANMFFIPAAIFAGIDSVGWDDALKNWLFAFAGNLVGASIFVAGAYWFLYGRDEEPAKEKGAGDTAPRGDMPGTHATPDPAHTDGPALAGASTGHTAPAAPTQGDGTQADGATHVAAPTQGVGSAGNGGQRPAGSEPTGAEPASRVTRH